MFSYYMPTRINFGKDCLTSLVEAVKHHRVKNILIFTGGKSAKISGALKAVKDELADYNLIIFEGIKSNPPVESLKEGIEVCRRKNTDLIIAVGGGSVIDYGKAVSALSKEKGQLHGFFYRERKLKGNKVKFIAVPTTFGTSSEVTPYAVMTDEAKRIKITLVHESMFPDYAFTDPKFTLSMPKSLIATSCADLFSHAVEAYWNVNATELTNNFAVLAIGLFLKYYKQTFQIPKNLRVRERISLASIYAGLAFSNTGTTACHSISYPMTTIFKIPHGIACALTLSEMLKFNFKTNKSKILGLCGLMNCNNVSEAKNRISLILNDLNIKTRLRDYGLVEDDLKLILDKGFALEKMINNPRKVTKQDLKKILQKVY